MAILTSIDKRSFDQMAADWIRNAILSGELAPGSKVTELGLTERIGLSRSTVRTAMQRLAGDGLLIQHAYTGWEVASLSSDDAWELYTLRCGLEGLASKLAAERIDDAGRKLLSAAFEALKLAVAAKDRREVAEADIGLHKTIVGLAKHRRLSMLHTQIIAPIHLYVLASNRAIFDDLCAEHAPLVDAILRGDSVEAQRLGCEHVTVASKLLLKRFEEDGEQIGSSRASSGDAPVPGLEKVTK